MCNILSITIRLPTPLQPLLLKIDLTIFNLTFQGSPAACHCPEGAQAPQGSQLQIFLQRWTNWVDSKKDISYFRRPHKRVVFEGAHQAR